MAIPVRITIQVGDDEPSMVSEGDVSSPGSALSEVATALRQAADNIERGEG